MKYILLLFCIGYATLANAQLRPANKIVEKNRVKTEAYDMVWYMLRDTAKFEIGKVSSRLIDSKDKITLITTVAMKGTKGIWVDSSTCQKATFSPIRHTSYNAQRDIILNFGPIVTGVYTDKRQGKKTVISDTTQTTYFDSNFYPTLIRWLPLKEGFTQKLAIYDYNPSAKIGVITASITGVSSGQHTTQKNGSKEVWVVTVTDEISNGTSTYFIDKTDRKLWKQTMEAGKGRAMMMIAVE